MKKLIRYNNDTESTNIDIQINFNIESKVLSTEVNPILVDNMIDDQALADYNAFIETTWEILDYYGFELLSNTESGSYPHTSKYYWIAHITDVEEGNIPLMIKLRISDHAQHFNPQFVSKLRKKNSQEAENLKTPKDKLKQRYLVKEVIVNNQTYRTYEEALGALETEIRSWLESLNVDMSEWPEPIGNW